MIRNFGTHFIMVFCHLLQLLPLLNIILPASPAALAFDESERQIQFEIIRPNGNLHRKNISVSNVRFVRSASDPTSSSSPYFSSTNPLSTACSNVMPGLNRLRRGVDVAKLDLFSLQPMSADDGFRKPIVDFTCSEGKQINVRTPGGDLRSYDLPDQVHSFGCILYVCPSVCPFV